jgi:anti-anti-sigma factor
MLKLSVKVVDGTPIVFAGGEIGLLEVEQFRDCLRKLAAERHDTVVIDASELEYMFSEGLGVMVELALTLRERSGRLILRNPSRRIAGLINATTLDQILTIESDEADE